MRIRFALSVAFVVLLAGCNTATLTYPPDNVADANLDACYFQCFDGGGADSGGDATLTDAGDATEGDAADAPPPVDAPAEDAPPDSPVDAATAG
jgi:hypothetical protein